MKQKPLQKKVGITIKEKRKIQQNLTPLRGRQIAKNYELKIIP